MRGWIFVCMILVAIFSLAGTVQLHEFNHVSINQRAGISSHIDYVSGFPAVATVRDSEPTKDLTNLELAHSFNESINYNTMLFFIGIIAEMILCVMYLGIPVKG